MMQTIITPETTTETEQAHVKRGLSPNAAVRIDRDAYPALLDTATAADMLNMSFKTIQKLCKDGKIPATKLGKAFRIPRDKLLDMVGM